MQVYLHQEYRQFTKLRAAGETITVRDGVGAGLVERGAACPVVNGEHQCQVLPFSEPEGEYLDEMLESPQDEMLLPSNKWSGQKRRNIRRAVGRSVAVRRVVNGRRFEDIQVGMLK